MINMIQITEKDKDMIKKGYIDLYKNFTKFILLKNKNYEFKNIDLKDIHRVTKNGAFTIYEYQGIYFEVQACLSKDYYTNPGYYMTFDNIMGNYYGINGSKLSKKMFCKYCNPKLAVKNYIKGLINVINYNNKDIIFA
jgi:hypothetical protein